MRKSERDITGHIDEFDEADGREYRILIEDEDPERWRLKDGAIMHGKVYDQKFGPISVDLAVPAEIFADAIREVDDAATMHALVRKVVMLRRSRALGARSAGRGTAPSRTAQTCAVAETSNSEVTVAEALMHLVRAVRDFGGGDDVDPGVVEGFGLIVKHGLEHLADAVAASGSDVSAGLAEVAAAIRNS